MKDMSKLRRLMAALMMVVLLVTMMPVALAASFSAYVTAKSMAVYADASLKQELGSLEKYTVVTVSSYSNGVAKISYGGRTGYAKVSAMEAVDAVAKKATVNTATRVYQKASSSSPSTKLAKNTKVNLIATNGQWALIEKDGVGGYTYKKYLTVATEATPKPTATPKATPKPTEAPDPVDAVVNAEARAYQQANTSGKYWTLKKGMEVQVYGVNGKWAYIRNPSNGVFAYIQTKYLSEPGALPEATATPKPTEAPTATAKPTAEPDGVDMIVNAATKAYQKASTSSKYWNLPKGMTVEVIQVSGNWAYIKNPSNGMYAYIQTKYLTSPEDYNATPVPTATPKPTEAPTATPKATEEPELTKAIVNANTKAYQKASTSSKYWNLPKGMTVEIVKISGNWVYIKNPSNGAFAYIQKKYLSSPEDYNATPVPTATPTATPAPTAEPELTKAIVNANTKAYQKASTTSKSWNVPKGMVVEIAKVSGNWAYIRNPSNGAYAYIQTKYLSDPNAATPTPEPTATPAPTATPKPVDAVVNAKTKAYEKPSTSSKSWNVPKGMAVKVHGIDGDWAYIRNPENGMFAYIQTKYLSEPGPKPTPTPMPYDEFIPAVVIAEQVAIYSAPDAGFWGEEPLFTLKKGTEVKVIAMNQSGSWVLIDYNGHQGWCVTDHLAAVEDDPFKDFVEETFGATVVTQDAEFFDIEGDGNGVAIGFGTDVTVVAYSPEWALVQHGKKYGLIAVSDLSRTEYAELKKGSSGATVSTLEKALLASGYFDGNPDNSYDAATEAAVKRFQTTNKVTANGVASQSLQRMLYSGNGYASGILSTALKRSDSGENVTRLQTRLFALGYLSKSSSIDGDYGNTTASAVALFQLSNGLGNTGTADVNTIRKMYSTSAVSLPSGKTPADQTGVIVQPESGNQKNNSTTISETLASKTSKYSSSMSNAEKLEYAIYVGQNQLGKPYVYGANGTASYDCTGFTCYCMKQIGVSLPRTAYNQGYNEKYERIYDSTQLKRGDLVFFDTVSDSDVSDHAGIYLGAGWFIHASSGQGKVVVSTLASGYYSRVFSWGHRVLG